MKDEISSGIASAKNGTKTVNESRLALHACEAHAEESETGRVSARPYYPHRSLGKSLYPCPYPRDVKIHRRDCRVCSDFWHEGQLVSEDGEGRTVEDVPAAF